jgi:hypothetical protein
VVRHRLGAQVQAFGDHVQSITGQPTLQHLKPIQDARKLPVVTVGSWPDEPKRSSS